MIRKWLPKNSEEGIFPWGGYMVTPRHARRNFLAVGVIGSGKSLTLEMLMNSALRPPGRAIVFDASTDLMPKIAPRCSKDYPLHLLHPFDRRSSAWDLASDLRTEAEAQAFAEVIAPRADVSSEGGIHYRSTAINIIKATILAFGRRFDEEPRARWTFRDLVFVLQSSDDLEELVNRYDDLALLIKEKGSKETFKNTTATLVAYIGAFRPAAAGWHYVDKVMNRRVSLKEWAKSDGVLLLGHDPQNPQVVEVINRLFVQRAAGALLARASDQAEESNDLSWVFIDEAARRTENLMRSLPPIEGLVRLINEGRKFGVCVALGFQGVENFRAAYGGADVASSILGMCRHVAVFSSTYETARWASEMFGAEDLTKPEVSETFGQHTSWSVTHRRFREPRVQPEHIMELPAPDYGRPLTGYFQAPGYRNRRVFINELPWTYIRKNLMEADKSVAQFEPIPEAGLEFKAWTDDERNLFLGRQDNPVVSKPFGGHLPFSSLPKFAVSDSLIAGMDPNTPIVHSRDREKDDPEPESLDIFRITREPEGL